MNAGHGAQPPQGAQPQSSSGQPALVLGDPAHSGGLKLDEHCGPFQPIWFCDSMISWLLCVPVAFLGVVQVFPARDLFSLSSLCPSLPSRDGSGAPCGSAPHRSAGSCFSSHHQRCPVRAVHLVPIPDAVWAPPAPPRHCLSAVRQGLCFAERLLAHG